MRQPVDKKDRYSGTFSTIARYIVPTIILIGVVVLFAWPVLKFFGKLIWAVFRPLLSAMWPLLVMLLVLIVVLKLYRSRQKRLYGAPLEYEQAKKMVREVAKRYAKANGLSLTPQELERFEAPGFGLSDYIDRAGICPAMEKQLRSDFENAYR